ncbi:MAG: hypothetical protein RBQ76_07660 [Sulfurovum sp.]|nr:hypothetical protein [Sulfurovum sp.]
MESLVRGLRENYCNQKRKEIMVSLRIGELPPILANGKKKHEKTFDNLAQVYFEDKELINKSNHKQKARYESQLKPLIGNKYTTQITKSDIEKIQKELAKTRASKTVSLYLQFINTVFNHAISKELFSGVNPVQGIQEQKVDNKRERFLTVEEVKKLLDALEDQEESTYLFYSL